MNTIFEWLSEYQKFHNNSINKIIHWICVPLIIISLFGLLSLIKFETPFMKLTIVDIFIFLVILYYLRLSISLSIGMLVFSFLSIFLINNINNNFSILNLAFIYVAIFILSWIGQFIGHKIEGKKPAFIKDIQFLLIGPLWLLSFIYKKFNIKL